MKEEGKADGVKEEEGQGEKGPEAKEPGDAKDGGDEAAGGAGEVKKEEQACGEVTAGSMPSYVWPDSQILTPRLKRLMDTALRVVKQVEADAAGNADGAAIVTDASAFIKKRGRPRGSGAAATAAAAGGAAGDDAAAGAAGSILAASEGGGAKSGAARTPKAPKAEMWSRKDRLDVYNVLLRFGLPPEVSAAAATKLAAAAAEGAAGEGAGPAPAPAAGGGAEGPGGAGAGEKAEGSNAAAQEAIAVLVRKCCPRFANKSTAGIYQVGRARSCVSSLLPFHQENLLYLLSLMHIGLNARRVRKGGKPGNEAPCLTTTCHVHRPTTLPHSLPLIAPPGVPGPDVRDGGAPKRCWARGGAGRGRGTRLALQRALAQPARP